MRRSRHSRISGLLVFLVLAVAGDARGFGTDTHQILNGRAARASELDAFLKQQLHIADGLAEVLDGRPILDWIQLGGEAEDEFRGNELLGAAVRSINHFHNPLRAWDRAGLDAVSVCPPFVLRGEASVRWAQRLDQGPSGRAAWGDARTAFKEALTFKEGATASSRDERDQALARTFRILGQQMHLVADLAVPAHTRNGPHCPLPERFEHWASRHRSTVQALIAGPPARPDAAIFTLGVPIQDEVARVPVARLWDADQYDGSNPAITLSGTIGLAEYTNANYFSDGTVFSAGLPFPASSSVALGAPEPEPRTGQDRRYFKKVGDGEPIDHVAVPSALYEFLPDALRDRRKGLDDKVFQDYAAQLLPRAVGYSAALLDYFFRGRLDVDVMPDPDDSSRLTVSGTLVSASGSGDERVAGTLALYWDAADGVRRPVPDFAPLSLDATTGDPIASPSFLPPAGAERFVAVYEGALGHERGVVIGKVGVGDGGVEELFIDDATGDLYFRNRSLVTRLDIREQLAPAGASIGRVIWGNDGVSFMVSVTPDPYGIAPEWAIFELSPRPARRMTWKEAPTASLVRQEPFDVTWTAAAGGGIPDEVFTVVLDSRRDVLYGGHRGRDIDPYNYKAAVLVNQSQRTNLLDYGIALVGAFGGGSVPYIVHADGADLAGSVVVVKSFAYLDGASLVPFRTSVWLGSSERILRTDGFFEPANHELVEHFGVSSDPVWPHSTRRHLLYSLLFTNITDPFDPLTRIYLHDVKTGVSRVVAEDRGYYPTPRLDLVARYDFRGSASTGVDRLFQASAVNLRDSTPLREDEREQFFAAWDPSTGAPLLDVTAPGYPPLDTAARELAKLMALPPGLAVRWPPVQSRAIQVLE